MAVAGRVLIKFRGNYDSTVSYSPLDAVFYPEENSTYVCKQTSLGNLPTNTTYWQIMAKGLSSVDPEDIGFGYGTCTTASDTDAKIVTLADYVLTVNGFVAISFTNAVNANATLNINNQGARPIYNKGVAIEDEVIEAGDTAAFVYDGTHYNLITSSGSSGHIIQGPAGTDIAKEKRMQFIDAGVTDDSTNGKTKVEVIRRVTSAQYASAPDGIYDVYDESGTTINLSQMGDVDIINPQDGEVLRYINNEWVNDGSVNDLNDSISAIVNEYGAKNELPYPYKDTTKTQSGITYTDNGKGLITVSGTASGYSYFDLHTFSDGTFYLPNGTYTLNGCPTDSNNNYAVKVQYKDPSNTQVEYSDYGSSVTFTINGSYGDPKGAIIQSFIDVKANTVISTPITFYPMIRDARVTDPTFAPYAKTNKELTFKSKVIQGAFTSATYGGLYYTDISLASYGITKRQIESITISQVDSNYAITATLVGDNIRCWGLGTANFNGVNFTIIVYYYENKLY